MSTIKIAAVAAAVGALALAGAAEAKPKNKHHNGDHRYYEQNWTPPGLRNKPGGMPPGQYKKLHQYNAGGYLPSNYYRNDNYYVQDRYYDRYNLPPAPYGYEWVRVGNDAYLAQTRTGLISQVIADLFN